MKIRKFWYIIIVISFLGGCSYVNKKLHLKNDNFLEKIAEDFIESRTGHKIDLTPESPVHD